MSVNRGVRSSRRSPSPWERREGPSSSPPPGKRQSWRCRPHGRLWELWEAAEMTHSGALLFLSSHLCAAGIVIVLVSGFLAALTFSFLSGTASQSTVLNHRCFFTSSAPFWKTSPITKNPLKTLNLNMGQKTLTKLGFTGFSYCGWTHLEFSPNNS